MAGEYFEWNFKKTLLLLFLTVFNLVYVCFCKMYFILCILVISQQDLVDNNFYWRVILDKYSIIIIIIIINVREVVMIRSQIWSQLLFSYPFIILVLTQIPFMFSSIKKSITRI